MWSRIDYVRHLESLLTFCEFAAYLRDSIFCLTGLQYMYNICDKFYLKTEIFLGLFM
jgi:hypothetical protein